MASVQQTAVTGTVSYPEKFDLPVDATLVVQLSDVSQPDNQVLRVSRQAFRLLGRKSPVRFRVEYDDAQIREGNLYRIHASVRSGDQVLLVSERAYPVITRGNPTKANLVLIPPGPSTSSSAAKAKPNLRLEEMEWRLLDLGNKTLLTPAARHVMTLYLSAGDHRFLGDGGCAPITGAYETSGNRLRFSNVTHARKSCLEEVAVERQWMQTLETVTSFEIRGRTLFLYVGDGLVAKLEAAGPKEIK